MKFPCLIAARMGSSRLPGKTLMKIEGREMIGMIIDRVKMSPYVSDILIATTDLPEDDKLVNWATQEGISTFRGQSFDMLGRISDAVKYIGYELSKMFGLEYTSYYSNDETGYQGVGLLIKSSLVK